MTKRRSTLLALVFGFGLTATAASAETLAEAIALAYDTNPTLLSQRTALKLADEAYFRTARNLGPEVAAEIVVSGDRSRDQVAGLATSYNTSSAARASLSAVQPIYTGGRISAGLKAQENSLLAQREALRRVEHAVVQAVIEAYVGVRRAEQSLAISQENVRVLERQREEAQARFDVGASTRTDVAQAESRLAASRTAATTAQTTLDNARAQYRTIVGRSPEMLAPEPSLAALLPATREAAFQTAQLQNPALRAAYLDERASAAQIAVARSERRPQVSVGLSADYFPDGFRNQIETSGITGSARLTIPLYTGLTTSSNIRSAEQTNRVDRIGIEGELRALQQNVSQSWSGLISARANIISSEEGVRAARLAAEGTREEQQVGLRTTLDLLNAEQELRAAEQTLVNARSNEYVAAASLLAAMGKLDAQNLSPGIEVYDPKKYFNDVNGFFLPWEPVIRAIDTLGAAPIPERPVSPGEVVPTFEGL